MAAKLFIILAVAVMIVGWTEAYPPRHGAQKNWQLPRLFEAACRIRNATTGKVVQEDECKCGDQTVACDVGPINYFGIEMTFCNKLDDQTDDQVYVLQYACLSGQDANCGPGTSCDIGPLTYDRTEYFLCRLTLSTDSNDFEGMCKPVDPVTQLMSGMGVNFGRGVGHGNVPKPGSGMDWQQNQGEAANGVQPANPPVNNGGMEDNAPANSPVNRHASQQHGGPGMGWNWNHAGMEDNAPANSPVNRHASQQHGGPGMGWNWNHAGMEDNAPANSPVNRHASQQHGGPGMGRQWNQAASQDDAPANSPANPPSDQQQWGQGMGWNWNHAGMQDNAPANSPVNRRASQQHGGPGMGRQWNQAASQDDAPANSPANPPSGQQQWGQGMGAGIGGWGFNQAGGAHARGHGMQGGMNHRGGRRAGFNIW